MSTLLAPHAQSPPPPKATPASGSRDRPLQIKAIPMRFGRAAEALQHLVKESRKLTPILRRSKPKDPKPKGTAAQPPPPPKAWEKHFARVIRGFGTTRPPGEPTPKATPAAPPPAEARQHLETLDPKTLSPKPTQNLWLRTSPGNGANAGHGASSRWCSRGHSQLIRRLR